MVADALTKPVPAKKFLWCRDNMGVQDLRAAKDRMPARGGVLKQGVLLVRAGSMSRVNGDPDVIA
jgi:hypothetical protein